ncbi:MULTISPECIES: imidazole glycerol phosphate synthase subunit HisH [unclassified Thalassospira]|jgi:glutamine amidotransferase|uniref:imidazole glycerol phosphate synthase subunit HisH n=1 Tax=unclassified Thalassospira TaxID=2648997 RepID=UPI0007A5CF8A|nr:MULTISPECIES: imidazole glycerol phosphate synthase subunit HisH [unclassified Thalassospira]KZC99069.1 hypothetical protein AUQ41_11110 [Thalassospira sp. MCCC 1A02898]
MIAKNRVGIVNYGVGNLMSVKRAVEHCGAEVALVDTPEGMDKVERLILPGVGAFGDCMLALDESGLRTALMNYVAESRPLLGICVGMQMLFDVGEEFGEHKGLGLVSGRVVAILPEHINGRVQKIPHIGWAELELPAGHKCGSWANTPLSQLNAGDCAYFVHSFTAIPDDSRHLIASSYYGNSMISAAIKKDNIVGVQFHPEKSGATGLKILSSFIS